MDSKRGYGNIPFSFLRARVINIPLYEKLLFIFKGERSMSKETKLYNENGEYVGTLGDLLNEYNKTIIQRLEETFKVNKEEK